MGNEKVYTNSRRFEEIASWEEKEKHLRKFTWKMYNSGYKESQARYIVKESIKKYDNMVKEDKDGTRPIHRDASWKRREREEIKERGKEEWYKNKNKEGGKENDAPLFVPWTEGSELLKN